MKEKKWKLNIDRIRKIRNLGKKRAQMIEKLFLPIKLQINIERSFRF